MIKHILKRLSILNTYNTYVFDLVKKFVNARSIMKPCVSKRLTTAFNLWLFSPTLIKSGQLLGLFDRVGTCTRVHTYLGGHVLVATFYSLPFSDLLQCIQNSPDSTGVSKDSVVLLSYLPCVPYYLVLISVEHCTETTLGKLGHASSIISWFSIQLHFLKCTKYGNRFILKEFIDNFCQFVYYWHIFWFVTYLKHPCDVREHISLKS